MGNSISCQDGRAHVARERDTEVKQNEVEVKNIPLDVIKSEDKLIKKIHCKSVELDVPPKGVDNVTLLSHQERKDKDGVDNCSSLQPGSVSSKSSIITKKSFPNGSTYIGDCDATGVPHGRGKYTSPTNDSFEGEFQMGKIHGNGTMIDSKGNKYSGTWFENKRHGKGIERLANGDTYEGLFDMDKRDGFGRID